MPGAFPRPTRRDDAQPRHRREAWRQLRRRQHQLHRLRRLRLPAQAIRPRAARASQWLGHPHPPSGLGMDFRVWQQFWRLLGDDQFQINGIRVKYWEPDESFVRSFKQSPRRSSRPPTAPCRWLVPASGAASPRDIRADRPDPGSSLSLRRGNRIASGRAGAGREGGAPGLGAAAPASRWRTTRRIIPNWRSPSPPRRW